MAEEDALKTFTNQLMYWQREGYYVLLNSFFNMKEKNMGFVVSANQAEQKFIYKLYINKELTEKHFPFDQVNEMIAEIDQVLKS
jgi:hypothetical protein